MPARTGGVAPRPRRPQSARLHRRPRRSARGRRPRLRGRPAPGRHPRQSRTPDRAGAAAGPPRPRLRADQILGLRLLRRTGPCAGRTAAGRDHRPHAGGAMGNALPVCRQRNRGLFPLLRAGVGGYPRRSRRPRGRHPVPRRLEPREPRPRPSAGPARGRSGGPGVPRPSRNHPGLRQLPRRRRSRALDPPPATGCTGCRCPPASWP